MNPDDEPEDGHGAPQPELGAAPGGYVPPKNMYAMGLEESDATHADAEVAEGEPEDGEYVDAELEQHQAAQALRYESEISEDADAELEQYQAAQTLAYESIVSTDNAAGHASESGAQAEQEEWGAAEADADAPAPEDDDQTATVAYQASEAAEGDDDVDAGDDGDEDDTDGDDDDDNDSDEEGDDEDDEGDDDDEDDDDDDDGDEDETEDALGGDQQEYAQEEYAEEEPAQEAYADAASEDVEHTVAAFAQQTDELDEPGALYEPTPTLPAQALPPPPQPQRPQQQRPQQHEQSQRQEKQQQPRQAPVRRVLAPVQDDDGFLFGAPDIPMPPARRRIDKQRARDARANLDLDLGRIKRIKRFGLVITTATVLFVAFVLAPVTWAGAYLFFDPPANVLMMQRAAEGETIRHQPVPINRISPHMVRAVIAAEDANFCAHDGFDVAAIQDAMAANARGGRTRGASTISQQTAKNLFLWPDRSWLRKGLETYFTALVEFMWPKRRIMEAYLNTAEWGDGIFGVEAAARARFGVSAADLTPLQAARLAAVLPNPNRWRADAPGPYVRQLSAALVGRARVVRDERLAACVLNLDRP